MTMVAFIERLSKICARLTGIIVVILCVGLVGSLLISIFFRYVVGQALSWPEEISLTLFAWLVLLTGSLGVREGFHVRLTIITLHLPQAVQLFLDRFITLAICGFGIVLIYSGYDLVQRTAEHLTATLRLSLDWLNYSAPICGILILLHGLSTFLMSWKEH